MKRTIFLFFGIFYIFNNKGEEGVLHGITQTDAAVVVASQASFFLKSQILMFNILTFHRFVNNTDNFKTKN